MRWYQRMRITLYTTLAIVGAGRAGSWPDLRGLYLGQTPPGPEPRLFAPSLICTEQDELNGVFSPDGKIFIYTVRVPESGYSMRWSEIRNGRWTPPKPMPFQSSSDEVDMCFTVDGRILIFSSKRPEKPDMPPAPDYRLWKVERLEGMWARPRMMRPPLNRMARQLYPCLTQDGTLYFQGDADETEGGTDIFRSRCIYGRYQSPENLGIPINSIYDEGDVYISPDERFMVLTIHGHPQSLGGGDLFIARRGPGGKWNRPVHLGQPINSAATEYCPMVTPDGRYFFFSTTRNGNSDIYWVDAESILGVE